MKISNINYFVYLISFLLLLFICNHIRRINNIKICKWKSFSSTYDTTRKKECQKYIQLVNNLNIFYFIGFGSLLGAVRNEGIIKNDTDIDIINPISKNCNLFKCNKKITITDSSLDGRYVLLTNDSLLCNKSRSFYIKVLVDYVMRNSTHKIIKSRITEITAALHIIEDLYNDFYPIIANEWIY